MHGIIYAIELHVNAIDVVDAVTRRCFASIASYLLLFQCVAHCSMELQWLTQELT